ncbi:MAG: hypothetical protein M3O86_03170, partial [Actinomycetota bacterium]|nr:hypothetical protein [Actinomycetota bacterium]
MPERPALKRSGRELRDEVEALIRDDLTGPAGGDEEELHDPPVDRYLLGLLAPRFTLGASSARDGASADGEDPDEDPIEADVQPDDDLADAGLAADSAEEGTAEDRPPAVDQLVPSAFGLTFALAADARELAVTATWGAYARVT